METLLSYFIIAVIWTIVVDYLHFFDEIKPILSKIVGFPIKIVKPFSCSVCLTFWSGIIYSIICGGFCLQNIMWLLLISCCCPLILNIIYNVRDILEILINIPLTFFNLK